MGITAKVIQLKKFIQFFFSYNFILQLFISHFLIFLRTVTNFFCHGLLYINTSNIVIANSFYSLNSSLKKYVLLLFFFFFCPKAEALFCPNLIWPSDIKSLGTSIPPDIVAYILGLMTQMDLPL